MLSVVSGIPLLGGSSIVLVPFPPEPAFSPSSEGVLLVDCAFYLPVSGGLVRALFSIQGLVLRF